MRKLRHYLKSMNYHVYFKSIKDVNNKVIAKVSNHQILTDNQDFIDSVTDTNVEQKLPLSMFGKNYIKHTVVDTRTGDVVAKVDNRYNVFSLDDMYIGSIVNHIIQLVCFYALLAVTFVTLIICLLTIKSTIKMVVDSKIVISEADGEVVVEEWNVFGKLKSEKVLYPGKTGVYYFTISNENDNDVNIIANFKDDDELLDVPIRYRLKCTDGTIISNEWVPVNELFMDTTILEAHSEKTYVLEWVWLTESDELDTIIGSTENAKYTIIVEITSTIIE